MQNYYTDEQNTLLIISLLKEHGIRKVIASPGGTNISFVASIQNDSFFEVYSAVDERSAAYMACGMAEESGEAVVISCTGATASRNYLPGLTEAYYRKLPVLAITSSQVLSNVGHHIPQVIDRSSFPNDVVKLSVTAPVIKDKNDLWSCEINVNKAILELKRHGGGPVHINLLTNYSRNHQVKELPKFRVIERISPRDNFPKIPKGKVAILIGSHSVVTPMLSELIDKFCATNNGVVFCDHTSNYKGKYRLLYALVAGQKFFNHSANMPDLLIHIGEITGDYYTPRNKGKNVWRVNEDGEIRDTFKKLQYVFEMPEDVFFENYIGDAEEPNESYFNQCKNHLHKLQEQIPEVPFSNIWVASKLANKLPKGSRIHFGILNSLRSWNFFEIDNSILSASNVGGFGIDGIMSSLLGASLVDKSKLYFAVVGDLAFFYDMNAIGNRHLGKNIRVLLVNNGLGTEFRQYSHRASVLGEDADKFVAASGHFGSKSPILVKHYAEDLGFEYMSANTKEEFVNVYDRFVTAEITDRPMLLEVFTTNANESEALERILDIEENVKGRAKELTEQFLGKKSISVIKKVIQGK